MLEFLPATVCLGGGGKHSHDQRRVEESIRFAYREVRLPKTTTTSGYLYNPVALTLTRISHHWDSAGTARDQVACRDGQSGSKRGGYVVGSARLGHLEYLAIVEFALALRFPDITRARVAVTRPAVGAGPSI